MNIFCSVKCFITGVVNREMSEKKKETLPDFLQNV